MYGGGGGGEQSENVESRVRLPCQHRHQKSVHVVSGKLGQMSKDNMRRLETIKDKNILEESKSPFLRILVVIGRYGPHLMTVMIFVTQNNFETVQEFPTVSLDCTLLLKTKFGYLM